MQQNCWIKWRTIDNETYNVKKIVYKAQSLDKLDIFKADDDIADNNNLAQKFRLKLRN